MKIVRYNGGSQTALGVKTNSQIHALADLPAGEPDYKDLTNLHYLDQVRSAVRHDALSRQDASERDH